MNRYVPRTLPLLLAVLLCIPAGTPLSAASIIEAVIETKVPNVESSTTPEIIPGLLPNVESSTTPEVIPDLLPNVESDDRREVRRERPLRWEGMRELRSLLPFDDLLDDEDVAEERAAEAVPESTFQAEDSDATFLQSASASLGPNLVPNPGLESGTTLPASWFKGGYGTNQRTLTYPVTGDGGGKAVEVTISSYTSGDAKWFSAEIPVDPGKTYQLSDRVRSTVESIITIRYKKTDGSFIYSDVAVVPPHANFTDTSTTFVVPSGVASLSIFHLIKSVGTLTTDNYSLNEVIDSPSDGNLMPNPDLEMSTAGGLPTSWFKGGYGTNQRTLTYPVTGDGSSKAAQVTISNYSTGDAKWVHESIAVDPGVYTYRDSYKSNITSYVTVEYERSNGSFSYLDIAVLPPQGSFTPISVDFSVPSDAESIRIFHLIKSNGTLTIDSTGLFKKQSGGGIFSTGAVSLSFDDGWRAHHDIVMPKLDSLGLDATFYIISHQLTEDGFPGFMTHDQVEDLRESGHEIGAHTRTHRPLTSLSSSEQEAEIEGSRQDLIAMGVGPITTFAYPFGDYNASVLALVEGTPYDAARSTINGNVVPTSDIYQLPRFSVESHVTLANVQQAIDNAIANKEWIILVFHRVDESGERYSTTPANFRAIADYVDSKNVPVPTIAEGVDAL